MGCFARAGWDALAGRVGLYGNRKTTSRGSSKAEEKQRSRDVVKATGTCSEEVDLDDESCVDGLCAKDGSKHCTAWEIELAGLSCLSTHAGLLLTDLPGRS
jgi:hypothetical protein